jgi:hypothetical protein
MRRLYRLYCVSRRATVAAGLSILFSVPAWAQSTAPAQAVQRVSVRGVLEAVTPGSVTVRDRSGEIVEIAINDKLTIAEVYPLRLEDIQAGSYIGTAALPQPDGTLKAIAVTVFTEAQRNIPDGHFPFNLQPQSTMTNAVVDGMVSVEGSGASRKLLLKYKGGEKALLVGPDTPVVTSRPSDRSLLVVGASVSLFAQVIDGKPTALRIGAGKNGFALPY